MEGIPPARASDNEDVIWALETAESLWKRNARADAIVWLRRAAQEAAEAGDAERAADLTADAATLSEALGHSSSRTRAAVPISAPPPELEEAAVNDAQVASVLDDVDALLAGGPEASAEPAPHAPKPPPPERAAPPPAATIADTEAVELDEGDLVSLPPPTPVPTGDSLLDDLGLTAETPEMSMTEEVPALMEEVDSLPGFDAPLEDSVILTESVRTPRPGAVADASPPEPAVASFEPEATSLEPEAISLDAVVSSETSVRVDVRDSREAEPDAEVMPEVEGVTRMGADALSAMDLAGIPALAAGTDEQREALVQSASVMLCAAEVDLPAFALAVVLEGELIAGLERDVVIRRVGQGALIRTRGTGDRADDSLRYRVTADDTTVALWSEASLARALAGDPAVDERLRSDGDQLLGWVSLVRSPLGSRLPDDVRLRLISRLSTRALHPGEELLAAGQPVPGMLLVAGGGVSVDGPGAQAAVTGDFLFAQGTLSAGRATGTARAGDGGALVFCADRRTTQELCATEPLLLELLAAAC